ncbi:NmrA family NAD(P)-binding protein [Trinickia sp.]|uniref:NmrA family NAD(P)-binding protein n=1 Tax=Trinickia sp. TaxID=2571163 RepID=UPI003F80A355
MYVIFGASGKVGSVTAAALRHAGKAVRAVVRDERQAQRFAAIGCETVMADLTDSQAVRSAIEGAYAVQILCPVPATDTDPEATMRYVIDVAADALHASPPVAVLALSDYGAEVPEGTGITLLYRYLEARLTPLRTRLTLLRSAEHMENWARVIPAALARGVLPSLHHPLTKTFPTVAARDVGTIAAQLLLDGDDSDDADEMRSDRPRIVSAEGPQRISAIDVAQVLSDVAKHTVTALALPRGEWNATLRHAGLTENHTRLIAELYDAHNAGKIDVEAGQTERRFGATPLSEAIASMLSG